MQNKQLQVGWWGTVTGCPVGFRCVTTPVGRDTVKRVLVLECNHLSRAKMLNQEVERMKTGMNLN